MKETIIDRETHFRYQYVDPRPGKALVVGSKIYNDRQDARKLFNDAIGIDMEPGDGVDLVYDLEEPLSEGMVFDHIMCCSVLEHCRRPWLMAQNIEKALRPKGSLYIHAPTVWRFHGYPSDYWRYTSEGIRSLFPNIVWKVMKYSDWKGKLTDPPKIPMVDIDKKSANIYPVWGKVQIHAFGYRK